MPRSRKLRTILIPLLLAATWLPLLTQPASASPGDLDPKFNEFAIKPGFIAPNPSAAADEAYAMALQSDGKIVIAGNSFGTNNGGIMRLNANGDVDTSFGGGDGLVTIFGDTPYRAVAIQSDGKILVADGFNFTVQRFTSAGDRDLGFGSNGIAFAPNSGTASDMAIQPDGKIVVVGNGLFFSQQVFVVARFTQSGALDSTFSGDGVDFAAVGTGNAYPTSVAIQPCTIGSTCGIVVGGYALNGPANDSALARFTFGGGLDPEFGVGGTKLISMGGGDDQFNDITIQPDGKIVAVGTANLNSLGSFAAARFQRDGGLDLGFGTAGKVVTHVSDSVSNDSGIAVGVEPDGKIVAGGRVFNGVNNDFTVLRYSTSGVLDQSFGSGGIVSGELYRNKREDLTAMAIQPNGKIVAAGWLLNGDTSYIVARYLSDEPHIAIADTSATEGSIGFFNYIFFTVTVSGAGSDDVVKVHYATESNSATTDDYTPSDGTLTFNPGETSKTIDILLNGDTMYEGAGEYFWVNLSSPVGGIIDDSRAVGIILDDDPVPTVSLTNPPAANEDVGKLVFTVSLSNPSSKTVSVDYATQNGNATAPADYTAKSGTKAFLPGQTSKTITVPIVVEEVQEPTEYFYMVLSDPDNATLGVDAVVATIYDDDRPLISINDKVVTETNGTATVNMVFTVTLSKAATATVSAHYQTVNGTAVAPGDYTTKSGTLTFSPGQTSKTITIVVRGDNIDEPDENFSVILNEPLTGANYGDATGVGTIKDND